MVEYKIKKAKLDSLHESVDIPAEAVGITIDFYNKLVAWLEPVDLDKAYQEAAQRMMDTGQVKKEVPEAVPL